MIFYGNYRTNTETFPYRFRYIKFDFMISQSGGFIVHTGHFQDFINNNL